MNFINKLSAAWTANNSLLCVGLDPDLAKLPAELRDLPDGITTFCTRIIDATADLACAFKPQIAYFAALGAEKQLEDICRYVRENYPHIPLILDAKRGDIGATATQYAREAFERYGADAVTVNPYMGEDSLDPYLAWKDRGVIILCRTSNPGGSDLQFLNTDGEPLYQRVARLVAEKWNKNGQCALVVGATFPEELAQVRAIVGDMPLLVPGIGAQGGDIAATVGAGQTANGMGMMISSSRAIIYATPQAGEDFADAARRVAIETRDAINAHRASDGG
ncbi:MULTISPECIES: orotidine-5'-phosphate decarboxylase [unclassified Janthinobacterium]|uniref:orotidine-5'-phosphate decarboxylase n=1 Tax=unclassified Janthinobacterium TaxID=2610881 RepID=UPI0025B53F2D|nr:MULTISPECIES: orotidine-5'-phosphate decarboxylase [unclassified Janthinobacterium]MDN2673670.1 orotidine-5'-phosphate decarboxylase [Janthinobacterium sp. SUN026]MDN2679519.1 orotidine-5'-phosphate decarboxylase [Janthinobacterium sp. SUN033]MDN2705087.1 orotidine-5'-phosphate decarboxylase [Janthinobacterium sp. SUN100]